MKPPMGLRPANRDENVVKSEVGQTIGFCRLSPRRCLIQARQTTKAVAGPRRVRLWRQKPPPRGGPIGNRPQVGNPPHNRINNFSHAFWKGDGLSHKYAYPHQSF
jgi:hypothetical protein